MKLSSQNYELSRNQKISDSDLCDNELSDFKDDENKSVKTLKPYQLEPEQEVAEADTDESEIESFEEEGSYEGNTEKAGCFNQCLCLKYKFK